MTNTPKNDRSTRRPDCVTEIRIGNSVLVVSGYFKQDTTATAASRALLPQLLTFISPRGGDFGPAAPAAAPSRSPPAPPPPPQPHPESSGQSSPLASIL